MIDANTVLVVSSMLRANFSSDDYSSRHRRPFRPSWGTLVEWDLRSKRIIIVRLPCVADTTSRVLTMFVFTSLPFFVVKLNPWICFPLFIPHVERGMTYPNREKRVLYKVYKKCILYRINCAHKCLVVQFILIDSSPSSFYTRRLKLFIHTVT